MYFQFHFVLLHPGITIILNQKFIVSMKVIILLLHMFISINYTEPVTVQSGKQKPHYIFHTKGFLILRIGYKGIRKGWRSKQNKGGSVQFYPLTPPDQVSISAYAQKTKWYRLPHWTSLTSDFGQFYPVGSVGRRQRGKENDIRYLLPCFLPCWIATAAATITTDTTEMLISSHFLPLLLPPLLEALPGTEREMAAPFLLSSNLFVSARHWQIQGSLWLCSSQVSSPLQYRRGHRKAGVGLRANSM